MKIEAFSRQEYMLILKKMIESLDDLGIQPGASISLFKGGEDALCFRELFYAAKTDERYAKKWQVELKAFNEFFAKQKYPSSHMGFPLE